MYKALSQAIAVSVDSPGLIEHASKLAQELGLPLLSDGINPHFLLVLTPSRLELRQQGPDALGPIYADFLSGPLQHRRRFGGGRKQPLARAIGLKPGYSPWVLDTTAGLGRDAFVLACLDCHVQLLERSPIISALLHHGLEQAALDPEIGDLVRTHLHLTTAEAHVFLEQSERRYPVVYLDPMYPHRSKSALVKKEMRILRQIVGNDDDAPTLLATALQYADQRVVVKRPRLAPALTGPKPTICIQAGQVRFDVYLTR